MCYQSHLRRVTWLTKDKPPHQIGLAKGGFLDWFKEVLARMQLSEGEAEGETLIPALGGWVGFFSYDFHHEILPKEAGYKKPTFSRRASDQLSEALNERTLDACWLFTDRFCVYDHVNAQLYLVALYTEEDLHDFPLPLSFSPLQDLQDWLSATEASIRSIGTTLSPLASPIRSVSDPERVKPLVAACCRDSYGSYLAKVQACKTHLIAGDAYELCLTSQFSLPAAPSVSPYLLYRTLRKQNPAPFSFYLHLDSLSLSVLSFSPEEFLCIERIHHQNVEASPSMELRARMRPIKGTARRDPDPVKDASLRAGLLQSPKERSENLMIVDLCRHDLGRLALPGSVRVPALFAIESHPSVHQMVSTIICSLPPTISSLDVFAACFPPGIHRILVIGCILYT